MNSVILSNGFVRKKPMGASEQTLLRIAKTSMTFADQGVTTPVARYDSLNHELVFPHVNGLTGRELLHHEYSSENQGNEKPDTLYRVCLKPLISLHQCEALGELKPYDSGRLIRPRLKNLGMQTSPAGFRYQRLKEREQALLSSWPDQTRVNVHGDFHPGNIVVDESDCEAWLLDLDDVALGQPEIDLGNFIAHVITNPDLCTGDIVTNYHQLKPILVEAYGHAPLAFDSKLLDCCAGLSLLRRGLKFVEQKRDQVGFESVLRAIDSIVPDPQTER